MLYPLALAVIGLIADLLYQTRSSKAFVGHRSICSPR